MAAAPSPENRSYVAIDLKSFFASVECRERDLDPLTTNLVVADASRTEKTICLAVTPALKAYGIPGRPRLFEVVQRVQEVNTLRRSAAPGRQFTGKSHLAPQLDADPSLALDYIVAPPQMARYIEYSGRVYDVYLHYIAPEDIHVYSIDEVFMDVTDYLRTYGLTAHELARQMISDVLDATGITATAGIGSNLYLCKIAMDIEAKHMPADADGVRIAELDEMRYRRLLWTHRPITDFWRIGRGYARKLAEYGMHTMGDVARCSLTEQGEDLLYRLFGVNAELLIDHAWGWEPCQIADIKGYTPGARSVSNGQVLHSPYDYQKTRIIVREMTDQLVLDLVSKRLVTDQVVLTIGYDVESLTNPEIRAKYHGEVVYDHYGRPVPKHAHGSVTLPRYSSSSREIIDAMLSIYDRTVQPDLLMRRVTVAACRLLPEDEVSAAAPGYEQMDLFAYLSGAAPSTTHPADATGPTAPLTSHSAGAAPRSDTADFADRERALQEATLRIHQKYGKNALLKGTDFLEGATTRDRNQQIGGHKA